MRPTLNAAFLFFAITACPRLTAQDQSCSTVMSTPALSIAFLEEQKDIRQSPCISSAIRQLGRAHDAEATRILASYLDFVDPATLPNPDGSADVRPQYPAIAALFQIGKPATHEILSAIQTGGSQTVRQNAVRTYQAVYRDDLASGIRLLKKEELVAVSSDARHRLRDAAELLIDDCSRRSEPEAQRCKTVAGG
jgi:hypothetical protein